MLNNNVALTVQLTDVANAPKNVNGINKTYNQASDENNYRGWVMNYKPETNLITITGTLVTHSDLVCQINGFSDKYASINADSLSKETRVCFCIKAPKGFYPNKKGMNDFCNAFEKHYLNKHDNVASNFDKQINCFVRINKASSFIYSAATDEANASLVIFTSFNDMNFFAKKHSLVKRLVGLVRSSVTIKLS
jgi:hypothetical protein